MGGVLRRWWLAWGQLLKRRLLVQGAGARGASEHFRPLLLRRPVLRPWCGTQGERWRVREWRQVQGVAERRAKRSARCAQEERSGHISIETVSAEEE
eukprot:scaffold11421_cov67-Phaeocystis_antarctica.AAC.12